MEIKTKTLECMRVTLKSDYDGKFLYSVSMMIGNFKDLLWVYYSNFVSHGFPNNRDSANVRMSLKSWNLLIIA